MRKIIRVSLVLILSILVLTTLNGCSKISDYQKGIYDDSKEIVKQHDSFTFKVRIGNSMNNEASIKFSTFNGMETLWSINAKNNGSITLDYDAEIDKGDFKLVLITPDNEIVKIFEGSEEGEKRIDLIEGESRIKIVGKESKGKLTIYIKEEENVKIREVDSD